MTWKAQSYFYPKDRGQYQPALAWPVSEESVILNSQVQRGWTQRVPYTLIESLTRFADHKRYRQSLYDEQMADDPARFAGLKPVDGRSYRAGAWQAEQAYQRPSDRDFL